VHYFITGHTGFKGAWLTQMLRLRGHAVSGLSLNPLHGSLFETAQLSSVVEHDFRIDIRDSEATAKAMAIAQPDVVIHLAAQPLVRASYQNPEETFSTNVMGTMNVLAAVRDCPSVQAHLVITTDKVYRNDNKKVGYKEDDPLGGSDPYSASKAMADLLTQSWISSFPSCPTAIARAGNVIGGGDVSPDRLLPDLLNAFQRNEPAQIRYPHAVRPWQHVLDCLNGYLVLTDSLLEGKNQGAWNFGPSDAHAHPVSVVADLSAQLWGNGAHWTTDLQEQPHEASLLLLDSAKARSALNWHDKLNFHNAVAWTLAWEKQAASGSSTLDLCQQQLRDFAALN